MEQNDSDLLQADGLQDAIIGVGVRCGKPDILVYDVQKVIDVLTRRDGMSHEDAWDFFHFNIEGAWHGECTPIWMYPINDSEDGSEDERIAEYAH
jgi:hypothetical protein